MHSTNTQHTHINTGDHVSGIVALASSIVGLFITQTAIGATVIIGAVLLIGIVGNNAIILMELANQIHSQEHCDQLTAMLKAAPQLLM